MSRLLARTIALFLILIVAVLCFWPGSPPVSRAQGPAGPATAALAQSAAFLPLLQRPDPTPTATATPIPTATPTAASPGWLTYLNSFRTAASLPPLVEEPSWAESEWLHSRYMVKEDDVSHSENPASPWYSDEGHNAGTSGNIFVSGWDSSADNYAIDFWMAGPFHAVAMLDPQLHATAFGSYREAIGYWHMGATLDWRRGLGDVAPGVTFPIFFPRDGGELWLTRHPGYEFPDPLASCPGYVAPTGPPLFVQLGSGTVTPQVTAHDFSDGSTSLAHCVFDETTYYNPNAGMQQSGRLILNSRDAIVLMPQTPLIVGRSYTATITSNGITYTWHFTVVPPPLAPFAPPAGQNQVLMP